MPYANPDVQREYQRRWRNERRGAWFAENGPCVDCGSWRDLQLDHRDNTTRVDHRVWSWSKKRREAELAKCTVRCLPCHAAKTTSSGEHARGERHGSARLTSADVERIRSLYATGAISQYALADLFGVHQRTISNVVTRKTWAR